MLDKKRQLLWHGVLLFLLGLIVGFIEQKFTNPRMGLAAHLEGLMNGTFLIALGAIWAEINLTVRLKALAYWGVLYGAYGNWVITSLAAVFGTAAMTPITAEGHRGLALAGARCHLRIRKRGDCDLGRGNCGSVGSAKKCAYLA